jgi:cytochrome b561
MAPSAVLVTAVVTPLILWRLYARARRHIGRQPSVLWRHWAAATGFPLMLLFIGTTAAGQPGVIAGLAGGAATGAALAVLGLRLTRFEHLREGFFYTPNAYIGIGLSAILVTRLIYSFMRAVALDGAPQPPQTLTQSPLTLAIAGMHLMYYAAFAAGVLRWRLKASRKQT